MKPKVQPKVPHLYIDKRTGVKYALFTYTDRFKRRKYVYRRARNASHVKDLYAAMAREFKERGEEAFEGERMTFNQLADYAEENYIKPPVIVEGRKLSGMKSWKDGRQKLSVMRSFFGRLLVTKIGPEHISAYRDERLGTPTKRKNAKKPKQRALASVQRELSLLRHILNIARRKRWIVFNPFDEGNFISEASEEKRTRIIEYDEEDRLLLASEYRNKNGRKYHSHLRGIIICGVETGMRCGEMFKITWLDIDRDAEWIVVVGSHTKTEKPRKVPITPRLAAEFDRLWEDSDKDPQAKVFGLARIKKSWPSLCKLAGVEGVTPHDMRHTAATRMIEGGMELAEVARILGHAKVETTYRYINLNRRTIRRAIEAMDRARPKPTEHDTVH